MRTRAWVVTVLSAVALAVIVWTAAGCTPTTGSGDSAGADTSTAGATSTTGATVEDGELTIAIAGMVTPKEGLAYYQELSRYVGKKVGKKIHLFHKAEYAEVNDMLEQRKVDVAFVCSGPYVAGHDKFGLSLLAAPQVRGKAAYHAYIIVGKDSPITSLDGLRGKSFAFTDPQSNTGLTVPTYLLAKMGTTPKEFFSKTFFTYSHDNSIKAVATGQADGAAVDSLIWDYADATDPKYTSRTRIVQRSDPYGIPPVVVHPDIDPVLRRRLKAAFLGADEDPEGRRILRKMQIERFVEVDDGDYDAVRAMNKWIEDAKSK